MGRGPHVQVCRTAGAQKHPGIVTGLQATVLRLHGVSQGLRARLSISEKMTLPRQGHGLPPDSITWAG